VERKAEASEAVVHPEGSGVANPTASPVPERRHPIGDQRFGDGDVKRERTPNSP
jgi:hypothetical protein